MNNTVPSGLPPVPTAAPAARTAAPAASAPTTQPASVPTTPPAAQTAQQNPLIAFMSMLGGGNQTASRPAPQPAAAPPPQENNFLGGLLGGLGNMFMPLIAIVGMVFLLPKLFSGDFMKGIGDFFGNMFGGGQNNPGTGQPTTPSANTPTATPVSFRTNAQTTSVAPTVLAAVRDVSNAQGITNNKNEAQWASVDPQGFLIRGNRVNEIGDTASTTKAISAWLVATDPKLKAAGGVTADMRKSINEMSAISSNIESDNLMNLVAKARGVTPDALIREYNQRLDDMGFKNLEIANFSGLPTASSEPGRFYVEGLKNVGTAYELALAMQKFGSEAPDIVKIFAPPNNHTGMGGVNATAVKTGTARGVIAHDSGANKSAVAFRAGAGSIGVMESMEGEWMPTINRALDSLSLAVSRNVAPPSNALVPPPQTPATNITRRDVRSV